MSEKYSNFGFIRARKANDTLNAYKDKDVCKPLYPHLVFEGEVSCLFSDTNIGKSIFAVQIGAHVAAQGHTVAYYDFELSEEQFYNRYSDNGKCHKFPDTFIRLDVDPDNIEEHTNIIQCIEEAAIGMNADTLIIDNLSWLCMDSEDGAVANALMKEIKNLQIHHGWTILVVAHTPKRNEKTPLSVNDLAGSRQLANFFDSIFALGRCCGEANKRYLKQCKVRSEEVYYTSEGVLTLIVEKRGAMLQMVNDKTTTENAALGKIKNFVPRIEYEPDITPYMP